MAHPYIKLEGTPPWATVESAINDLVINNDLVEKTAGQCIVGYGRHETKPRIATRLKDFALYILICVLMLAAIAGLASTGMKWDILFKLLQSMAFPIVLFGIGVPERRSRWRNRRFWLTIGVALLTHAVLFAILASRVDLLKPVITCAIALPEFLLWMIADRWQMELATRHSKHLG